MAHKPLTSRAPSRGRHYVLLAPDNRTTAATMKLAAFVQMAEFARSGWALAPARTGCGSPVSRCGRFVGRFTAVPARLKSAYLHLSERKRYSDVSLVAGILAVPVTLGAFPASRGRGVHCLCRLASVACMDDVFPCAWLAPAGLVFICLMDAYYSRRPHLHQL